MDHNLLWRMLEGQILNKQYQLKKLLGSGSLGAVFFADELIKNRPIRRLAVKLIVGDRSESQLDQLFTAASFKHPHLIDCYSMGESQIKGENFVYISMELADSNLETYFQRKMLSETEVFELTQHLASALDFVQTQPTPLFHRNLKPTNILKVRNNWKIGDLGLVKLFEEEANSKTTQVLGTPIYAPPEAYNGVVSLGWDSWSVGVIIYQALMGKSPFTGQTTQQLIQQIINAEVDVSKLPSDFQDIALGCLAKEPSQRWSATQLLKRLEQGSKNKTAEDYLEEGNVFYEQEKFEEAIEKYTQAIEIEPKLSDAYNNRGVVRHALEDFEGAIADYTKVIKLNPNSMDAYNNRGVVKYDLEDYQGAIRDYTQALKLNPNFADAYYNRGVARYELREYQEAIEDYTEAIKNNPEFADAYYERGNAYSYSGDPQKAKKDYNKAIQINPSYIEDKEELNWEDNEE